MSSTYTLTTCLLDGKTVQVFLEENLQFGLCVLLLKIIKLKQSTEVKGRIKQGHMKICHNAFSLSNNG